MSTVLPNDYEAILEAEGMPKSLRRCGNCGLEELEPSNQPLDILHQLLMECGMSPQEFQLTAAENKKGLKDFLMAQIGYTN